MYVNESPSDLALERADYNWPYLQTNNSAIEQDNDSEERQRASTPADSVRYYPTEKKSFHSDFLFFADGKFQFRYIFKYHKAAYSLYTCN